MVIRCISEEHMIPSEVMEELKGGTDDALRAGLGTASLPIDGSTKRKYC